MAVAILERELDTLEKAEENRALQLNTVGARDLSDEQHNAGISEAYAKLINPKYAKVDDILGRRAQEPVQNRRELFAEKPYLVENARADAEIFRADSPVNRREIIINPQVNAVEDSEEENEDLRPTQTTIQYKTTGVNKTAEESNAETTGAEKRTGLSKKEKIVIAVVISVIVAMFALIIINSAILSGINADMSSLQASLTTVKASYAGISSQVKNLTEHAFENAEQYALSIGLIK
ncbi:MAG: hypothetical protein K2N30_01990 [Clostridia bacterium]|nr:hypothetical protein [Clostridia bacterium]